MENNITENSRDERLTTKLPAYKLIRSSRKTIALIVHSDNSIEIRCPKNCPKIIAENLLFDRLDWIEKKQQTNLKSIIMPDISGFPADKISSMKRDMLLRIKTCLADYNGPTPDKWTVRLLKSRWGSCSSRRSITINLLALYLPDDLFRYLILHELTHLTHMNHSRQFWQSLEDTLPQARSHRKKLMLYRL